MMNNGGELGRLGGTDALTDTVTRSAFRFSFRRLEGDPDHPKAETIRDGEGMSKVTRYFPL
jgi:chromosome condensin MukBEF MukE localization factor